LSQVLGASGSAAESKSYKFDDGKYCNEQQWNQPPFDGGEDRQETD
jgi:hypothetical protein